MFLTYPSFKLLQIPPGNQFNVIVSLWSVCCVC